MSTALWVVLVAYGLPLTYYCAGFWGDALRQGMEVLAALVRLAYQDRKGG